MTSLKRLVAVIVLLGFAVFALVSGLIIHSASTCVLKKSDVIIVLGCRILGTSPSWPLKFRLDKACELYKAGYASKVIVSGGQGPDEETYEATAMKDWLVASGVRAIDIIEETASTSTYENLKFSQKIMEDNSLRTAIVVTNDYHVFRALRTARKLGIEAEGAPATNLWYLRLYSHCREVLAVLGYAVRGDI